MKHRRLLGTLIDAGPLFALVDQAGQRQAYDHCWRCIERRDVVFPMVTSLPCLTESLHLAGMKGGREMQHGIIEFMRRDKLTVSVLDELDIFHVFDLMDRYPAEHRARAMDFADATLVVIADREGYDSVFTLDGDFYRYRLRSGQPFQVIAGPLRG